MIQCSHCRGQWRLAAQSGWLASVTQASRVSKEMWDQEAQPPWPQKWGLLSDPGCTDGGLCFPRLRGCKPQTHARSAPATPDHVHRPASPCPGHATFLVTLLSFSLATLPPPLSCPSNCPSTGYPLLSLPCTALPGGLAGRRLPADLPTHLVWETPATSGPFCRGLGLFLLPVT